ncbi:MAG: four helix bundle protein [Bacteroidia bacterium]|nr:four helix bundle protein [Bacteroidia bacterium]
MKQLTPRPIHDRCFEFAVSILKYSMVLKNEKQFEIAGQLIRSGTSICANLRESKNAISKSDFIFKLSIAQKEADETIFWLELIQQIRSSDTEETLINEASQILKIIKTISLNTKRNYEL